MFPKIVLTVMVITCSVVLFYENDAKVIIALRRMRVIMND